MSRKGFTLIELLVVVAVLALLASIVTSNLGGAREGARISNALSFQSQTHSLLGSDLVGWWNFNENLNDFSGHGNNGTWGGTGGPNYVDGVPGTGERAVYLDSDNTNQISTDLRLGFTANNSFTFSFWVKFVSDIDVRTRLFSPDNSYSRSYGFYSQETGRVIFAVRTETNSINRYSIVESDEWNLFTGTYNGILKELRLHRNGEQVSSPTTLSGDGIELSNNQIVFNRPGMWSGSGPIGYQDIVIGDARIYSRALSASEIQTLYAQTKDNYLANE